MQIRSGSGIRYAVISLITLIIGVSLAMLAVSARGWLAGRSGPRPRTMAAIVQSGKSSEDVPFEHELLTLRRSGFEPAVITRPHGKFGIIISNRSEVAVLALKLTRMKGNKASDDPADKLKDVDMKEGKTHSLNQLDLPPGDYILTEAGHPEWTCRITLTSK